MFDLKGTPYSLDDSAGVSLLKALSDLQARKDLLREQGKLSRETLEIYYGKTRFEQIAESNAIEGSTLSVGETELAVLKGVTISGHDPGYSRDARSLAKALQRLATLAKEQKQTDITEVKELHELIMDGRMGAGLFRNEEIRISGSRHRPPRDIKAILDMMGQWEAWSTANPSLPAPVRAVVLHTWLAHIHPFLDGNGRTSRAIGNLELIRAGHPPIIIRARKDRSRYLTALASSDEAGDLTLMFDLVLDRIEDALRDLERAAREGQGYDAVAERIRKAHERQLSIWSAAVQLLTEIVALWLSPAVEKENGQVRIEKFSDSLSVDDYILLCEGHPISKSWAFRIRCEIPGLPPLERLAWAGFRSQHMKAALPPHVAASPSLFWSRRNPHQYPPWVKALGDEVLGGDELTLVGDQWHVLRKQEVRVLSMTDMAREIADSAFNAITTATR